MVELTPHTIARIRPPGVHEQQGSMASKNTRRTLLLGSPQRIPMIWLDCLLSGPGGKPRVHPRERVTETSTQKRRNSERGDYS